MSDPLHIRVDYDFASSLCYVAHRTMQRLAPELEDIGVVLDWSPIDLTLMTRWERGAEVDEDRRANVMRVSRELDVPLRMPRVWLDSRRAHAIGLSLPAEKETSWREAVWTSVFESGTWLQDETLDALARDLGLGLDEAAVARGAEELVNRTRSAHGEEVTGVPTFMLGPWPFGGIQNDDTMLSILGRFAERQREAT